MNGHTRGRYQRCRGAKMGDGSHRPCLEDPCRPRPSLCMPPRRRCNHQTDCPRSHGSQIVRFRRSSRGHLGRMFPTRRRERTATLSMGYQNLRRAGQVMKCRLMYGEEQHLLNTGRLLVQPVGRPRPPSHSRHRYGPARSCSHGICLVDALSRSARSRGRVHPALRPLTPSLPHPTHARPRPSHQRQLAVTHAL